MSMVRTLVITGNGTNCEVESAHAARMAGSDVTDIIYFSDLRTGRARIDTYDFLIFPGGFLDGDDLGAAQAAAVRWRHAKDQHGAPLLNQLTALLARGGLILGICNGFQLLVKLGLLPALGGATFERQVTLSNNDSARFEDRWVTLAVNPQSPCLFTKGVTRLELPVRHGEGKLVVKDPAMLDRLMASGAVVLQYADPATGQPTMDYPANPNGSPCGIAGLTDPTGHILGLMPHPEAFNDPTNHPNYTRGARPTLGTVLFENAVSYLRQRA